MIERLPSLLAGGGRQSTEPASVNTSESITNHEGRARRVLRPAVAVVPWARLSVARLHDVHAGHPAREHGAHHAARHHAARQQHPCTEARVRTGRAAAARDRGPAVQHTAGRCDCSTIACRGPRRRAFPPPSTLARGRRRAPGARSPRHIDALCGDSFKVQYKRRNTGR